LLLTAKDTCLVAWPALSRNNYSMARRSSSFAAKHLTYLGSSSEQSVRAPTSYPTPVHLRTGQICSDSPERPEAENIGFFHCSQVPRIPPKNYPLQPYPRWSLPFPCSCPYLLQDRPWHDSTQDRSRCSGYGETQGL
jgi:hypothetical protein